jgi:hypothetical protein
MVLPRQAHPFFNGVDWERLYSQRPPYTPVVAHELDTRNFENFEVHLLPDLSRALLCQAFPNPRRFGSIPPWPCAVLVWPAALANPCTVQQVQPVQCGSPCCGT